MGIILEDDTLPNQSFFWYCEELLEKYKNEKKIGIISGNNFQDGKKRGDADYYFSIYPHIWGWASWAVRWKDYDFTLNSFRNDGFIDKINIPEESKKYFKNIFEKMKKMQIDTWDYQLTFLLWKKEQLSVLPNVNLVINIGFNTEGTHTKGNDSSYANLPRFEIMIEKHPIEIEQNIEADYYSSKKLFSISPLHIRALNKIKRMLK